MWRKYTLSLLSFLAIAQAHISFEKDMTITVQAGATDCFYQPVGLGDIIQIDYQVIDAAYGQLEISFQLAEPQGRIALADYKKPENSHNYEARLAGDYRFCFDNSFSTFSTKTVFFDLMIQPDSHETQDYDNDMKEMQLKDGAESYNVRVQDIMESVEKVEEYIHQARRLQEMISAHEARDRNVAEDMNSTVLRTSLIQLFVMALVGFGQIFFLRNLFEKQSEWLVHLMERWSKN